MMNKKTVSVAINGAEGNEGYVKTALSVVNNRVPYKAFVHEDKKDSSFNKNINLKGMIKLGLGVLYFLSLVFFLTQLLI